MSHTIFLKFDAPVSGGMYPGGLPVIAPLPTGLDAQGRCCWLVDSSKLTEFQIETIIRATSRDPGDVLMLPHDWYETSLDPIHDRDTIEVLGRSVGLEMQMTAPMATTSDSSTSNSIPGWEIVIDGSSAVLLACLLRMAMVECTPEGQAVPAALLSFAPNLDRMILMAGVRNLYTSELHIPEGTRVPIEIAAAEMYWLTSILNALYLDGNLQDEREYLDKVLCLLEDLAIKEFRGAGWIYQRNRSMREISGLWRKLDKEAGDGDS